MDVIEHEAGDVERLEALTRREEVAKPRNRDRMVLPALRGEGKLDIARTPGVAQSTLEGWVYRYRDGGGPEREEGETPPYAEENIDDIPI